MPEKEELEAGLIKALKLTPDELPEAKYNLLGFFSVLHKIDQRLKAQQDEVVSEGVSRD